MNNTEASIYPKAQFLPERITTKTLISNVVADSLSIAINTYALSNDCDVKSLTAEVMATLTELTLLRGTPDYLTKHLAMLDKTKASTIAETTIDVITITGVFVGDMLGLNAPATPKFIIEHMDGQLGTLAEAKLKALQAKK